MNDERRIMFCVLLLFWQIIVCRARWLWREMGRTARRPWASGKRVGECGGGHSPPAQLDHSTTSVPVGAPFHKYPSIYVCIFARHFWNCSSPIGRLIYSQRKGKKKSANIRLFMARGKIYNYSFLIFIICF